MTLTGKGSRKERLMDCERCGLRKENCVCPDDGLYDDVDDGDWDLDDDWDFEDDDFEEDDE